MQLGIFVWSLIKSFQGRIMPYNFPFGYLTCTFICWRLIRFFIFISFFLIEKRKFANFKFKAKLTSFT